jgi:hypothetical protein
MMRLYFLFGVFLVLSVSLACKEREYPPPVIVHVLRDPSAPFAKNLRQTDLQFGLSKARLNGGKWVMVATNEGNSYAILVRRLADTPEDLLILNSPSDLPDIVAVRDHVGEPQLVCGGASAYIPDWVSSEQREATEMYLRFLVVHCEASVAR